METKIVKALEGLNQGLLKPKQKITFDIAVNILNDILNETYQKEKYFLTEKYEVQTNLKDEKDFVFRLCATTELSETISVNLGGILYEEPCFAIITALNLKNNNFVLPMAKNYETYKVLQAKAELGLKKVKFKPDFFAKALRFFDVKNYNEAKPCFDFIKINKKDLTRLRDNGSASFVYDNEVKFFELYHNPDF